MKYLWMIALVLFPFTASATQVQEVVSDKGIRAWLVEEHALPLLAMKFAFRNSGNAYDPKGKEGRASMTAAMLMEGAGAMDAESFSKALEAHAIDIDFGVEKDIFSGNVMTISEFTPQAFELLGAALQQPRFDAASMLRVRTQMLSALQMQEKEPSYLLERQWSHVLFGQHAYANPELGTVQSIGALTDVELKGYMHHFLTRDRLVVAVVGDITPQALKLLLDKSFAGLDEKATPDVAVEPIALPDTAHQEIVQSDVPQTIIAFGGRGPKRDDAAFYDAYVLNYLLGGGGLSSRLFVEMREKRGLTYGISTGLAPMDYTGMWSGGFATRNEKVGEALQVLRDTLQRMAEQGPTEEELAKAKQYITGSFVLNLGSNHDVASYLMVMQLENLGRDYLDTRNGLMNAVTKGGVKKIAAQMLDVGRLQVVMVGKPVLGHTVMEEKKLP